MSYKLINVVDKVSNDGNQYTDLQIDNVTEQWIPNYVSQYVSNQLTTLLENLYPVGSIYYNTKEVNPNQFLPGTWSKIEDRFLLSSGSSYALGQTGGEAAHTLTIAETPAHTHTRGTMNITGSGIQTRVYADSPYGEETGAICDRKNRGDMYSSGGIDSYSASFDASRSWTGATSSVGGNQPHNNMPPYLVVNVWQRIS